MNYLETAINQVQAIYRDLPALVRTKKGKKVAPDWLDYPPSLTTAQLPIMLTWPAQQTLTPYEHIFGLSCEFIVSAFDQGQFNYVKQECLTLMDEVRTLMQPYLGPEAVPLSYTPQIEIVPGQSLSISPILPSPVTGDALSYTAFEYHGFRVSFDVRVILDSLSECG